MESENIAIFTMQLTPVLEKLGIAVEISLFFCLLAENINDF